MPKKTATPCASNNYKNSTARPLSGPSYGDVPAEPAPASYRPAPMLPPGVLNSAKLAGIRCRKCGCADLPVAYVRHLSGYTQRVRHCRHCGRRIVTREAEA